MRGKLAAFKMLAQDFGPTWEDWVDAAFRIVMDTKRSVISRTDSKFGFGQLRGVAERMDDAVAEGGSEFCPLACTP